VKHGDPVAQPLVIARDVRAQEDGAAARPIGRKLPFQHAPGIGVETAQRLVEKKERQIREQYREQPQLLGHALRIAADRPIERTRIEPNLLGQNRGLRAFRPPAVEHEREAYEIVAREGARRLEALRKVGHPAPAGGQMMRLAEDPDRARMRRDQHQDRLQQRALAGAAPTHQPERLMLPDGERDVLEGGRSVVARAQPLEHDSIRDSGHDGPMPSGASDPGTRARAGPAAGARTPADASLRLIPTVPVASRRPAPGLTTVPNCPSSA
jgi:hypothetical protein